MIWMLNQFSLQLDEAGAASWFDVVNFDINYEGLATVNEF